MTAVYGILGWPVDHTRAPAMYEAAFRAVGIAAHYVRFPVPPSRLRDAVRGLSALGVRGASVTLPHKHTIVPLIDDMEADARAIGAVDTLVCEGDRIVGANTDAPALVQALREAGVDPKERETVVVGAGGAARAAVMGLARAGAARIMVAARREDEAVTLVGDLARAVGRTKLSASDLGPELEAAFKTATLLVQATSATQGDGPEATRFAASLPLEALAKGAVVAELVYQPAETAVLRAARGLGLKTVDGLGTLLYQGALAFERWTEREAPLSAMREALYAARPTDPPE